MALTHSRFHLPIFLFFSLIFISQSNLELYLPDREVLLIILNENNIKAPNYALFQNPCNLIGILREWRMSSNACFLRFRLGAFEAHQLRRGVLSPKLRELLKLKEISLSKNELIVKISPLNIDCQRLVFELTTHQVLLKVPHKLSPLICLPILNLSSNKFLESPISFKCFPNLQKLSLANFFFGKVPCRFLNIFWPGQPKGLLQKSARKNSKRYIFLENQTRRYQTPAVVPTTNAQPPSLPAIQPHKHQGKNTKIEAWIFWVGILAGGLIGLSFSIFLTLIMLRSIKGDKAVIQKRGVTTFTRLIHPPDLAFLKEEDNLASLGQFVGKGGCGEVYVIELPNKAKIAVKKINQPQKNARELAEEDSKLLDKKLRQIKQEIKTVGLIRHRNLIPLLAHVPRPNCHYLVYEYMKNGSLEDVIYQISKKQRKLNWLSRHRIALGIASGLQYMHMDVSPRIIHRDLKPANILLDEDMLPKIADFGLSKAFPEINTHLMSNVAGTVGYIAPEYHETNMFSDKSDIFCFGIILAALVTGKLPTDEFFQHTAEMDMVKWMRNVSTSDDPRRAIDPNLIGNGHEELIIDVLKIACACTSDEPNERPSSKDVRTMLDMVFQYRHEREQQ